MNFTNATALYKHLLAINPRRYKEYKKLPENMKDELFNILIEEKGLKESLMRSRIFDYINVNDIIILSQGYLSDISSKKVIDSFNEIFDVDSELFYLEDALLKQIKITNYDERQNLCRAYYKIFRRIKDEKEVIENIKRFCYDDKAEDYDFDTDNFHKFSYEDYEKRMNKFLDCISK